MPPRLKAFSSSVGTKLLISLTGLALFLYLVLHLVGNALVFLGPETFNQYSHTLLSSPLLVPVELGLLAVFLAHIYKTVTSLLDNRRARPVRYVNKRWAGKPSRKSIASSTMIVSGLVIVLFVIIHVKGFKYGPYYEVSGSHVRDLYRMEMENFSRPILVAFYVVCMALVGFHLWHGFSSAFQSLGADTPRGTPRVLALGKALALAIAGGFLIIPLWAYFAGGRP